MKVDNIRVIGKGYHKIRYGGTDIADHDSADYQKGHLMYLPGNRQHKPHADQRAREGRRDHKPGAHRQGVFQAGDHHKGHHQLRPGGNPQHKGPRYGIREECLEKEAGDRQRSAQNNYRQNSRKPD